ncbi:Serine/threonine-protein kinase [Lachnellula occidentalis]|uniref:non-specific serine/threonine protein kinase n=1 Tax=Lachnellula occidentalis TaxID=215460 RepID=A0A8H8RFK8_9HELO|nr:Serine/threonine-protein kinase [Lachnellula occidentalis]
MSIEAGASQYTVLHELGSGSFGTVYKAIDKTTGEIVAIKHIDLESTDEDIQDIQSEISILSSCTSPYVTQYKASFLRGHKLWIVMEFLGGGPAWTCGRYTNILQLKPGNLNEAHVAIICRELLLGLEYLHQEGKIHRDVKAANVLLSTSGKVKLADFGVATQLTNIKSQRNTFVGTPYWMAPEVIQEAGYDYKADIWSLGITALELINGGPPHADVHPMKVLFLIPKQSAPRLEGSQYSKEFRDFIAQCLVKDCDRRPSAKELLRHKFIRSAGKVEALQELIERRQLWDGARDRPSHPKYYEETLHTMSPKNDPDEWVFDTVKKATIAARKNTTKRRKLSVIHANGQGLVSGAEDALMRLDIRDAPLDYSSPPPATIIRGTVRRQPSVILASPTKPRQASSQRRPLQPDMSFGNSASTVRVFRRVSDNSTTAQVESDLTAPATRDENRPPMAETVTKDAILGRRVFNKVIDPSFQEVQAQTGNQAKRDALSRLADAWSALDAVDPEGEYQLMKLLLEKVQNDSKLSVHLSPTKSTSRDGTPQASPQKSGAKLILAQNNPHLKSHRRRQSSIMPEEAKEKEKLPNLPGQAVPGMEHTKQLADVLYGRWAGGLRNRWPAV